MTAGLDHARGDAVVMMDVDLQDPPELVAAFVEKWRAGYDIAYGLRATREGETRLKTATALMFYAWFNRISDTPIPANVGDFRLLDRRVVDALRLLPERGRFMKGLFAWVGYPSVAVPFERPPRQAGNPSRSSESPVGREGLSGRARSDRPGQRAAGAQRHPAGRLGCRQRRRCGLCERGPRRHA